MLNKNKKEKDLIILYEGYIIYVEVKTGHADKYSEQHTHFHQFLYKNYRGLFSDFKYVLLLYKSRSEPAVRGCDRHIVVQ